MLDEDKKRFEFGCNIKHEARVISKPFDPSFISSVNEDGGVCCGPAPVFAINEVFLLEGFVPLRVAVEVVQCLSVVLCSVRWFSCCRRNRSVSVRWVVAREEKTGKGKEVWTERETERGRRIGFWVE